jgi:hypothetical protein
MNTFKIGDLVIISALSPFKNARCKHGEISDLEQRSNGYYYYLISTKDKQFWIYEHHLTGE